MKLLALAALLVLPLSGCLSCEPLVHVVFCAEPEGACQPNPGDPKAEWSDHLESLWPEIPRLMAQSHESHEHAEWSQNKVDAFWSFWGVPQDRHEKQVFLIYEGETYRVRILAC